MDWTMYLASVSVCMGEMLLLSWQLAAPIHLSTLTKIHQAAGPPVCLSPSAAGHGTNKLRIRTANHLQCRVQTLCHGRVPRGSPPKEGGGMGITPSH